MRKKIALTMVCLLALAFAFGAMVTPTQAGKPCIGTCLNGTLLVCCPLPGGGWDCYEDGPCDWPGWIP
jgi:hypothetical protein